MIFLKIYFAIGAIIDAIALYQMLVHTPEELEDREIRSYFTVGFIATLIAWPFTMYYGIRNEST